MIPSYQKHIITAETVKVPLHRVAHARAGDKGERLSICLFAYKADFSPDLVDQVHDRRVHDLFAHRGVFDVHRYLLPRLGGMNFVFDGALEGGREWQSQSGWPLQITVVSPAVVGIRYSSCTYNGGFKR
jgi:hypothetical protein